MASRCLIVVCAAAVVVPAAGNVIAGPDKSYGRIELIRDTWGIPHVFSDTDPGAMCSLGCACAAERTGPQGSPGPPNGMVREPRWFRLG